MSLGRNKTIMVIGMEAHVIGMAMAMMGRSEAVQVVDLEQKRSPFEQEPERFVIESRVLNEAPLNIHFNEPKKSKYASGNRKYDKKNFF